MITSVISQTYKSWELIIVDDCSTDNSLKIIKKYAKIDNRIKLIKLKKNSGPAVARNKGIKVSKGRYMAFLDSDDFWEMDFLKKSLNCIRNKAFIYSCYNRVSKEGYKIDTSTIIPIATYKNLLKGSPVSCLTAFIDTSKTGKKFFPYKKNREDLAYWLLLLEKCKVAYGYEFCEANYRVHSNSSSSNKFKMALFTWKDYNNNDKLSLFSKIFYFSAYILNGSWLFLKVKFAKIKFK